jgi:glycosyltransferase involved in cell wall biosynthesis
MRKACKVLMLVENLPVPADPRVWAEAKTLHDAGCRVSIICPKGSTKHQEKYTCIDGISIYRYQLPASSNKYTSYLAEFGTALFKTFWLSLKVLLRHGFDVIHAANPPDLFFLIGLFYRLLGKKYIFDQHDLAPEMFLVKFHGRITPTRMLAHKLLLYCEWCSYQVANYIIVTNLSQKLNATQRGRSSPDKVFVVRNGPDLKRLKPVAPDESLKKGRRYLLAYIGVMGQQDGVEYALHALYELVHKRGRQDVALVLMGDGDHAAALKTLAYELDLDSYVNFTGWAESRDIARYLSVADVGLSPDPQNGLNEFSTMIKTMEYMAMGKPVVAFDLAETRFSAQAAALYAKPNLVHDYADKIETLLDDEELCLKLGACGHKRIEEELRWENSKEHLLLVYKRLFPKRFEIEETGVQKP